MKTLIIITKDFMSIFNINDGNDYDQGFDVIIKLRRRQQQGQQY